ncbi:2-oxo-4-hydroxy-4-carboxy-5-ureidoimidazoline decarboxylase [Nitrincola iocasae]|uniref:2-oxo-4-hydroxy-4-carboxy-5-ureidoimidazoline decarboxylase n=1 Tax=Nitrincola iocasae TaxID=2614693 RepID=A0A5J6LHN2_9GAMM|nr:2-oxo-4-hydroxy-4-carboxy-5-ureidoimidazoline decarboxylase [Nitrincola iocasae]QEW08045.1 2-oxo-4-hydroxy-4-carboxy-5-ureidoimidazoline decarboxylase [Nitrincola iocasae]
MTLNELNQLDPQAAATCFRQCCVSEAWVQGMLQARPFSSEASLFAEASRIWAGLERNDYLQAFEGHPKIGDVSSLRAKYADTKALAAGEQSSVDSANEATINALAEGNQQYEARFGYIFIVCATGKSAEEMLALLTERLHNDTETEIHLAAAEQNKITQIRLQKLLQN